MIEVKIFISDPNFTKGGDLFITANDSVYLLNEHGEINLLNDTSEVAVNFQSFLLDNPDIMNSGGKISKAFLFRFT